MKRLISAILLSGLSFHSVAESGNDRTLYDVLRGSEPGLRVTSFDGSAEGDCSVHIRGVNSIRSGAAPLFVVDGAYLGNLNSETLNAFWTPGDGFRSSAINPMLSVNVADIAEIQVLRNVTETALYGSEGANGVILITTRNSGQDRLTVDWNSSMTLVTPTVSSRIFSTLLSHNHDVAVGFSRGGVRYRLSGWWHNLRGAVSPSDASYGGLRVNFETTANRYINFGLNASISLGDVSSMSGVSWAGVPTYSVSAINPSLYPQDSPQGWLADYDDDTQDRRALASAWIRVNFHRSLTWKTVFGVDYQTSSRYIWFGNGTSLGKGKNGVASIVNNNVLRYRVNSALEFNRFFAAHRLNVSLGYEANGLWLKSSTMNGSDFFNHSLRAKGLSLGAAKYDIFEIDNSHDRHAAFASLSYDWKSVVGASGVFRAEFLRRFHDLIPSLYPSGEVWTDLHRAFMPDFKPVSTVRLSAGYGVAGHDRSMAYETMHKWFSYKVPDIDKGTENYYKGLNTLTTKELHATLDLGFISDRLTLGLTYYDRRTVDEMGLYCFGSADGFYWQDAPRRNILSAASVISNKGFEFEAGADVFRSGNFSWRLDANLSYNVNQLYDVHEYDVEGQKVNATLTANRNILGEQAGALYGYVFRDGAISDMTGDGKVTGNDRVIIGNPIPLYTGALSSSFRYRDFMFDFTFDGAAGHDILNLNRMYADADPVDVVSDRYVERGDYLRLSNLSFSYLIPLKVKWIQSFKVSLSGHNLYTFTGYSGWNPDVDAFGASPMSAGMDYGSWPMTRSFMLGLSVEF